VRQPLVFAAVRRPSLLCGFRGLQRALQQRAHLRRQPAAQHVHAVVVDVEADRARLVLSLVPFQLFQTVLAPPGAHHLLHLRGSAAARDLQQLLLVGRRRHAREGPRLGI
jgi:hypothetical protein